MTRTATHGFHGWRTIRAFAGVTGLAAVLLVSTPLRAADDLRDLIAGNATLENVELATHELNAFYAARNYRPAWNFSGPDSVKSFDAFLTSVTQVIDYHGLRRGDYPLAALRKLIDASDDDGQRLRLEVLVTDTLLQLAHDLHGDTVDLDAVYTGWRFHRQAVDVPLQLAGAVATDNLGGFIASMAPKNPAYAQLAEALKIYRRLAAEGGWKPIPPGPTLRPKDHGPRVIALRARLAAENYLQPPAAAQPVNDAYDSDLAKAVALWQTRNGLDADGHVGPKTLQALNVPVQGRLDQIRANMERWRHMPDDFPPERAVIVNIGDATVTIREDGKDVYRGIVVVGRPDRPTPFLDSTIRSMIINPFWHVPVKIAQKDILPKLRRDPHYLEKLGITIRDNGDDPYGDKIDWKTMASSDFAYHLRQEPGDQNSLGRLKFDFNNNFAVYMHGTPHQELFGKSQRNFSSGCIRLQEPERVAEILLAPNGSEWTIPYIESEIATATTHWVGLAKPMPIYALYWTVFSDESGAVNFRKDVYGYDAMLSGNDAE